MSRTPQTPPPQLRYSKRSQWFFTNSEILAAPSIIDKNGVTPALEKANRSKGCQFIETVGHVLKLHQVTIATAAMFLHRFYMRQSMVKFHHYVLSVCNLLIPGCGGDVCIPCDKGGRKSSKTTGLDYCVSTIQPQKLGSRNRRTE